MRIFITLNMRSMNFIRDVRRTILAILKGIKTTIDDLTQFIYTNSIANLFLPVIKVQPLYYYRLEKTNYNGKKYRWYSENLKI